MNNFLAASAIVGSAKNDARALLNLAEVLNFHFFSNLKADSSMAPENEEDCRNKNSKLITKIFYKHFSIFMPLLCMGKLYKFLQKYANLFRIPSKPQNLLVTSLQAPW